MPPWHLSSHVRTQPIKSSEYTVDRTSYLETCCNIVMKFIGKFVFPKKKEEERVMKRRPSLSNTAQEAAKIPCATRKRGETAESRGER